VAMSKKRTKNLRMLSADVWIKYGSADNSCHVHYQSWKLFSFLQSLQ